MHNPRPLDLCTTASSIATSFRERLGRLHPSAVDPLCANLGERPPEQFRLRHVSGMPLSCVSVGAERRSLRSATPPGSQPLRTSEKASVCSDLKRSPSGRQGGMAHLDAVLFFLVIARGEPTRSCAQQSRTNSRLRRTLAFAGMLRERAGAAWEMASEKCLTECFR